MAFFCRTQLIKINAAVRVEMLLVLLSLLTHTFVSSSKFLRVQEGTPAGTVLIADLPNYLMRLHHADAIGSPETVLETKEDFILTIGNSVMPGVDCFGINPVHKSLVIKKSPDRDALCPSEFQLPHFAQRADRGGVHFSELSLPGGKTVNKNAGECVVKLSLVYGPASNPSFDMITIILEDINDHAPTFSVARQFSDNNTPFIIKVPESYGPTPKDLTATATYQPTRIALPLANDPDYGVNGIHGYHLEGEDAYMFRLEVNTPVEEIHNQDASVAYGYQPNLKNTMVTQLWLVPLDDARSPADRLLTGHLDREKRAEYHIVLVAYDGGSPQRTARLPIKLLLEDVNDQSPVFNQAWYSGKVSEDDPPGSTVLEFSAHDSDIGEQNGKIGFRIPGEKLQQKVVGKSTGKVAYASGSQAALSESQLAAARYFAIEYVPDATSGASNFVGTMRQNVTRGRLIIRHQSKEQTRSAAAQAIEAARRSRALAEYSSSGAIPKLSNEQASSLRIEFVVEAYDYGYPTSLTSRVPVYVDITDVNNHAPEILVSYLQTQSHERANNFLDPLEISGWGRVRENVARAMLAQIIIVDEDDIYGSSDTTCNTTDTRFKLEEIVPVGDFTGGTLNSWIDTMKGFGARNQPTLKMGFSQPGTQRVDVTTKMYKLMLTASLDRENGAQQRPLVEFHLKCVDNIYNRQPGGQLTSQVTIRVLIEDVNDNPPVFMLKSYTFHVPENHPVFPAEMDRTHERNERYFIGQVVATDADEGWHAAIYYKIMSTPEPAVEIDPLTGRLYAIRPFDREVTAEFGFQVAATDCRAPNQTEDTALSSVKPLSSVVDIKIIVDDINDCSPVFDQVNYHFEVEEGINTVVVGQVTATDDDQGDAARLNYRLAAGVSSRHSELLTYGLLNPHRTHIPEHPNQVYSEILDANAQFQINESTGVIRLKSQLDRERKAHYEFVVLAIDNPSGRFTQVNIEPRTNTQAIQFTATATVFVTVLDKNDNPPQILSPRNNMEFFLGSDQLIAGNTIFTLKSDDPDLGENGTVEFELVNVEEELSEWTKSTIQNRYSQNASSTESLRSGRSDEGASTKESPFALDRTAGICYLRENLPPLNTAGPRAYLLQIRAYDLGRPKALNSSVNIRVVRQPPSPLAYNMLPTLHTDGSNMIAKDHLEGMQHTDLRRDSSGLVDTWTSVGQARLSDRTLVVVLSTVFALLLLTTLILILIVRYRRTFLQNSGLSSTQYNDSPLNKANPGYTVDKPFDQVNCVDESSDLFPEVFTAPWVNNSCLLDSPNSFAHPMLSGIPLGLKAHTNQRHVRKTGTYWPSMNDTMCTSPVLLRSGENTAHPIFHSQAMATEESPTYHAQVSRGSCLPIYKFAASGRVTSHSPKPLVLENKSIRLDPNGYYALTTRNREYCADTTTPRSGKLSIHHPESASNKLAYLSIEPRAKSRWVQSDEPSQLYPRSALKRTANSMEELHKNLESFPATDNNLTNQLFESDNTIKNYNTPSLKYRNSPMSTINNEYQRLLMPISTIRRQGAFSLDDSQTSGTLPFNVGTKLLYSSRPMEPSVPSEPTKSKEPKVSRLLLPVQDHLVCSVSDGNKCEKNRQSSLPDPLRGFSNLSSSLKEDSKIGNHCCAGKPMSKFRRRYEEESPIDKTVNHSIPPFPGCLTDKQWCKRKPRIDEKPASEPPSPIKSPTLCVQGSFV